MRFIRYFMTLDASRQPPSNAAILLITYLPAFYIYVRAPRDRHITPIFHRRRGEIESHTFERHGHAPGSPHYFAMLRSAATIFKAGCISMATILGGR